MVQAPLESAMKSSVHQADRIAVLGRGRQVEQGTQAQLVAQGGVYAGLAALQFNA